MRNVYTGHYRIGNNTQVKPVLILQSHLKHATPKITIYSSWTS